MPVVNTLVELWLAYHCTVCPVEHVAVKVTTPASHLEAPTTLLELGALGIGLTVPITP